MNRILVYSHDAYGLGNIRRMLEIVQYLAHTVADVSVLLVCGSPMVHAFRIPPGVDYIKLPCVGRNERRKNVVRSLKLNYQDVIHLRASLILKAALGFRPNLVLVDKKPLGIGNELELALTALSCAQKRPKVALLLRDILDEPEATVQEWEAGAYHAAIDELYDRVLIVGMKEVFDAVAEYRFPAASARKVEYCGYIPRPVPRTPPAQVRAELGLNGEPLVLVCAGGGADGYRLLLNYLQGLTRRPARHYKSLLVSGPEMSQTQRNSLAALAGRLRGVILKEFTDDMLACMNAAELVVSMGGYNSVCEILTLKKKALIVPRVRPVAEQWIRAQRLQELGLLRVLHPDSLTPTNLSDAVEEELARGNVFSRALQHFRMDGLERIGKALSALLDKPPTPRGRALAREQAFAKPALPLDEGKRSARLTRAADA